MKEREIDRRFDRLCVALAFSRQQDIPWKREKQHGAQHRKHHSRFEDLRN